MKTLLLLTTATLICLAPASGFADEASGAAPIHRTIAKRHVVRPVKHPVTKDVKPAKSVAKPTASSAK